MSNLALYRKYRSADFDEVVGQQHIVRTLQKAIESGKHSHAYLLTGPRGVGKTSIARIIAKRLNGLDKSASLNDQLDIIEIDGASNRGIDEVRSLREKILMAPTRLKYKVYIIDEVHMLTREAFNALLKTLEEPPRHVVFVFATTEVNKLPETIISRTQRFDFHPISQADLETHLGYIAKQEKINIDEEAIRLIAKISRGGFRDAISLLDQVASLKAPINAAMVGEFCGLQDPSKVQALIMACSKKDVSKLQSILKDLFDNGADVSVLTQQLLDELQILIESGSTDYDMVFLLALAENLHWVQTGLKTTTVPRLILQTGLLKTSVTPSSNNIDSKKNDSIAAKKQDQPAPQAAKDSTTDNKSKANQPAGDDSREIKALSIIKHYNNSLYAVLKGSRLMVNEDEVVVSCRFSFHRDRVAEARNSNLIEKAFSKVYGQQMQIKAVLDSAVKETKVDREQELMSSAMAILGGEVVDG